MKPHILVVEDEPTIAAMLNADLVSEGYDVTVASTGPDALRLALSHEYGLILLDVMLPGGKDGFEICREIRRAGRRTPVILLTARTHDAEKVMGLELGADDYITKPFNPRELRARIKAVLRRTSETPEMVSFGDVEVDFGRGEVRRGGRPIDVSALEFRLITAFVRHPGRLLTREQLLDTVWGRGIAINDRVIDNHIVSVRRKLEPDPSQPRFFVNVRGMGYRFDV